MKCLLEKVNADTAESGPKCCRSVHKIRPHRIIRPGARHLLSAPLLLHETIFRRSLSSSFDPFSVVPFSSRANLVVFGGSLQANPQKKRVSCQLLVSGLKSSRDVLEVSAK